jgi:alanine racemase
VDYGLTQTVYSAATASTLSECAGRTGKKLKIHVKTDSGMGRLGFLLGNPDACKFGHAPEIDPIRKFEAIDRLPNLETEGIFTHFATSDSADKSYANRQLERFMDFVGRLDRAGFAPPLKHAANSGALIDIPESHLDMVRPGIATYGLYPSNEVDKSNVDLKPVMSLKTRVIHVKRVPAGFYISYGITYRTKNTTTIATVPVGYADGFNRLLSSRGHMLLHGEKVPIVGRVCMDMTMLDVGALSGVEIDDEVVVFGRQGDNSVSVDELASNLNTINYEIVCSIAARVPRVYLR